MSLVHSCNIINYYNIAINLIKQHISEHYIKNGNSIIVLQERDHY